MKRFVVSVVFAGILMVLFVGGLISNSTVPTLSAFCLWTPAMIAIGWTARGMGKRLAFVDVDDGEQLQPVAPPAAATTATNGTYARLQRLKKEEKPL